MRKAFQVFQNLSFRRLTVIQEILNVRLILILLCGELCLDCPEGIQMPETGQNQKG